MGKEVMREIETKPKKKGNNLLSERTENDGGNTSEKDILDKIDVFGPAMGSIPGYSDEYVEFDDLERNEDTFGSELD